MFNIDPYLLKMLDAMMAESNKDKLDAHEMKKLWDIKQRYEKGELSENGKWKNSQ
jgi:hypothetical protein